MTTTKKRKPSHRLAALTAAVAFAAPAAATFAEDLSSLDKGHRLLIQNGLQVIGLVDTGVPFHVDTYQAANYTSVLWWMANTNPSAAPNMPWVESVPNPSLMPHLDPALNGAYMNKLVGLSLGDEQDLNDRSPGGVFDRNVQWFHDAQANPAYNNTILYTNSWGSQLLDQNIADFIGQARPDMVSFDTYPWVQGGVAGGSPQDWYTWMRRYRVYANAYNIPFAVYRQTYHATSEARVDPTPSQQNLNTFAALAFGSTYLADFTYNSGATSLFDRYPSDPDHGAGDLLPNARYYQQATINQQARNLGKALVRLKQVTDHAGETFPNQGVYSSDQPGHTTSIMFVRGKHRDTNGNTVFNDLPIGFVHDPEAPKLPNGQPDPSRVGYTDWVYKVNDPYLSGGFSAVTGVTNLGTKNDGLPGDVILSWFTPLDESFDGPDFSDERYLMVVNGLTGTDGSAADYRQEIRLSFNFGSSGINMLQRLDENTGQVVDVPLNYQGSPGRYQLVLQLDGGMGALFKFKDGAPFVGFYTPPHNPGDTNSDGVVDLTDLNNVLNNFGTSASNNPGDDNADGTVDLTDLNNVLNNFGTTYAAAALNAIPEPASLSLLAIGATTLLARRRRTLPPLIPSPGTPGEG